MLPSLLAQAIRAEIGFCAVVNLRGESTGLQPPEVDEATTVAVGALGKALHFLRQHEVEEVLLAGGVDKTRLFRTVRPDLAALRILKSLPEAGDDRLLRALTSVLEAEGFRVGAPVDWLPQHRAEAGPGGRAVAPRGSRLAQRLTAHHAVARRRAPPAAARLPPKPASTSTRRPSTRPQERLSLPQLLRLVLEGLGVASPPARSVYEFPCPGAGLFNRKVNVR